MTEVSSKTKTSKISKTSETNKASKTKQGKIGIVIPIYNVAAYLRECLDSVLAQTHQDYEAVLVNDGSTDFAAQISGEQAQSKSLQIALEYAAKDSRFVVIDKENGGLSSARNAGIAYFMGEIAFETRERERE